MERVNTNGSEQPSSLGCPGGPSYMSYLGFIIDIVDNKIFVKLENSKLPAVKKPVFLHNFLPIGTVQSLYPWEQYAVVQIEKNPSFEVSKLHGFDLVFITTSNLL